MYKGEQEICQGMGPRREYTGNVDKMRETSEMGHCLEVPCKDVMD